MYISSSSSSSSSNKNNNNNNNNNSEVVLGAIIHRPDAPIIYDCKTVANVRVFCMGNPSCPEATLLSVMYLMILYDPSSNLKIAVPT